MKKLLSILGGLAMIGTASATVVACGKKDTVSNNIDYSQLKTANTLNVATEVVKNTLKTDYTKLTTAINNANQALADNVNPNDEAEAKLKEVIAMAKEVDDDPQAPQIQIDVATTALNRALETFKKATATDYTKLKEAIEIAEQEIKDNQNPNPAAEAKLEEIIRIAKGVNDDPHASQVQINAATMVLDKAIETFKWETAADYSELIGAINDANWAIKDNKNPNADVDALQKAIDFAWIVCEDKDNFKQKEIDATVDFLNMAIETFKNAPKIDYTKLTTAINNANQALDDNQNPNPSAETKLREAIEDAKIVNDDPNASQIQINLATDRLNEKIETFKKETLTDYTKLKERIEYAHVVIDTWGHTKPEATEALRKELEVAEKFLNDHPNATQWEVNDAVLDLWGAIVDWNLARN